MDLPEFKVDTKGSKLGGGIIGGIVGSAVTGGISHRGRIKEMNVAGQWAERLSQNQFSNAKGWVDHVAGHGTVDSVKSPGGYEARLSQPDTDVTGEVKASDVSGRKTHRTGRTDKPKKYSVRPAKGGGTGEAGLTKKSVAAAKKAAKKDQK